MNERMKRRGRGKRKKYFFKPKKNVYTYIHTYIYI